MCRPTVVLALTAFCLGACSPLAADSSPPGQAGAPADSPASAPAADFSGDFNLTGTEPFWSMIIRPGRLMLSCAGDTDFVAPNSGPQVDGDTGFWDGGPLKVTLKAEPCSDGMSDRRYEFSAAVDLAAATPY